MVNGPRNWLITGGCGFVGVSLIKTLVTAASELAIRVVDNLGGGALHDLEQVSPVRILDKDIPPMAEPGVELVIADIRDPDTALRAATRADVIVHLAANTGVQPSLRDPVMDMECNVMGLVNYLEAARRNGVGSFVFASSSAPIGRAEPPVTEQTICRPISPYGASKLAGEAYCSAYHGGYGLKTVALRFSNVYGPLSMRKGSVVALFIRQALAGKSWTINGDGTQTRDFIHIQDIVTALVAAAHSRHGGEVYQISTQVETSVRDMAAMLADILEEKAGIRPSMHFGPPLEADVARSWADISKARAMLQWEPRRALREGLEETVEWFLVSGRG
jgi:UDP-glucose 4-epimerase